MRRTGGGAFLLERILEIGSLVVRRIVAKQDTTEPDFLGRD